MFAQRNLPYLIGKRLGLCFIFVVLTACSSGEENLPKGIGDREFYLRVADTRYE